MRYIHNTLAHGRWFEFSLFEQMGNIGSEVHRMVRWKGEDQKYYEGAFFRAIELIDLTKQDSRWKNTPRLKEICRSKELLCDAYYGGKEYGTQLEDMEKYFDQYAHAAALKKFFKKEEM